MEGTDDLFLYSNYLYSATRGVSLAFLFALVLLWGYSSFHKLRAAWWMLYGSQPIRSVTFGGVRLRKSDNRRWGRIFPPSPLDCGTASISCCDKCLLRATCEMNFRISAFLRSSPFIVCASLLERGMIIVWRCFPNLLMQHDRQHE